MNDRVGFPVVGVEAFERDDEEAGWSRAVQELVMATYAFGSEEQSAAVRADGDDLGAPSVASVPAASLAREVLPTNQLELDRLTREVRGEIGLSPTAADSGSARSDDGYARAALWSAVRASRSPEVLLAFLNDRRGSRHEVERVAASFALHAVPFGEYEGARGALESGLASESPEVVALAELAAGSGRRPPGGRDRERSGSGSDRTWPLGENPSTSIAIHGTWVRLQQDRWYAPEGGLHQLIRRDASPDLYLGEDYFRWTGGYRATDRADGAADLYRWLARHGTGGFDTVYAHSHGGNVALQAAGSGLRIGLLVLMHTPAVPRPAAEWARIREHVGHVVVLRTRLDAVVLGDGLLTGSTQAFDQRLLPHRQLQPHVLDRRGWFLHGTFISEANWLEWNLAREVVYERSTM